ncbi:MAG: RNA degradosome polyphosphate kinase [Campylobacterales bacterium]|nr:RNA degradosome polyphosphate kinase [Campylobacterales bacterium]
MDINLKDPIYYNNRELAWLQFNTRVLKQAMDESLPLLERLKFLAIYGTNLDEFYMIRVAGLKRLFSAGVIVSGADRLTPLQQLREIRDYLHQELQVVEHTMMSIFSALEHKGIFLKRFKEVTPAQQKKLHEYFYQQIYHVIVPIAIDATHPFPHLNNLSFGLLMKLVDTEDRSNERYGIVRIPRVLPRFLEVDSGTFVLIESIVSEHIGDLFPGYELISDSSFRVTRNADIAIEEDEADDFMEMLEEGLKLRKKGEMVRLELGRGANDDLISFFNRHVNVFKDDIYRFYTFLNLGSLWQIIGSKDFAHLLLPSFKPCTLPPLTDNESLYAILDKQDLLLFHPYESFDPVVRLIQTAAKDPDVVSIRMTLYRAGTNSPIVQSLIAAAESGKQVTAMVELKARFDEENNLHWAKALENAGAHVIYGITGLKVHAKAALVTRRVGDTLRQYSHIGTGNYNPSTAKIYTDMSYMTSNDKITNDLTRFFHFLTGFSKRGTLNTLYMSPTQIKPKLLELIASEAAHGSEGEIIVKVNALVDEEVIRALYQASQAGVKIDLIVRGVCCLRPGIAGVSENIRVISIIGKYLEHARILYFKNAPVQLYLSSADWMTRNLSRRIELLVGIENPDVAERLLRILRLQCSDNVLAHELQSDGNYHRVKTDAEHPINNHMMIEEYISKLEKAVKKENNSKIQQLTNRLFKDS